MPPKRAVGIGPIGQIVRANVADFRARAGISALELSSRIGSIHHSLGRGAISDIERGARRVDVDDLVSIAASLGVAPGDLLSTDEDQAVDVAGAPGGRVESDDYRDWVRTGKPFAPGGLDYEKLVRDRDLYRHRIDEERSSVETATASVDALRFAIEQAKGAGRDFDVVMFEAYLGEEQKFLDKVTNLVEQLETKLANVEQALQKFRRPTDFEQTT